MTKLNPKVQLEVTQRSVEVPQCNVRPPSFTPSIQETLTNSISSIHLGIEVKMSNVLEIRSIWQFGVTVYNNI